jgi:flagellin
VLGDNTKGPKLKTKKSRQEARVSKKGFSRRKKEKTMSISLINNLSSIESQSKLNVTSAKLNKTIQRLSTGLRINQSGDDAAGLAIANQYRTDISKLRQGVRNANDGVSVLQIVDGGLNTISQLLDRASALATQSASDTFQGNRDTLQAEYVKLMTEIDRQAKAIGLGAASGDNGRYNKSLGVFISGGATSSSSDTTNQVTVDLSNSRVDSANLGLTGTGIGASSGYIDGTNDFNANGATTAAETLTFEYVTNSKTLSNFTVAIAAGKTGDEIVAQLNADTNFNAAGLKAELYNSGSTSVLRVSSTGIFTAISSAAAGDQSGIGTTKMLTNAAYYSADQTTATAAANSSQVIEFSGTDLGFSNSMKSITLNTYTTDNTAALRAAAVQSAINNDTDMRNAGIFAIATGAAGAATMKFVALKDFNFSVNTAATAANGNFQTATALTNASDASSTAGGASGARAALAAIKTAITSLGNVQGKVGAGQNNLQQAIDLAVTQITNFQAAESRIRDADIAMESSDLSRLTVLQQAGISALAQANQSSQAVLSLLK